MSKQTEISGEIEVAENLKSLANAYEEISVMKMQEVRGAVLANRDFFQGLLQIFYQVETAYKSRVSALLLQQKQKNKNIKGLPVAPRNGKEVMVLLSGNNNLYGDIVPATISLFIETIRNTTADLVVIGRVGRDLMDQSGLSKPYIYFDLPDIDTKISDIKPLITKISPYEKVTVFFGKFNNVVNQVANSLVISGETPAEVAGKPATQFHSFFEPSLEALIQFFESQIFSLAFSQTVHEMELSRYASRITAMEGALINIEGRITKLHREAQQAKHITENKKQLSRFAGIALWGKKR